MHALGQNAVMLAAILRIDDRTLTGKAGCANQRMAGCGQCYWFGRANQTF